MKFKIIFSILFIIICGTISNAQLLQWNTFGNAGTETTEPSVFNNANIIASNLTLGAGVTGAGNGNRFGGTAWFDPGDSLDPTLAQAITGNDYIQFIVTPNTLFAFTPTTLVFNWERSATGPASVTLRSSVDGFTTDLGSVLNMPASLTTGNTLTISGLTNITSATTFRLYGYRSPTGNATTGGSGGFDVATNVVNVQLNGTTVPYLASVTNGDWYTASTWGGSIPATTQNIIINHSVTAATNVVRDAGTFTIVSAGAKLALTASAITDFYDNNGSTTINGTFELQNGSYARFNNFIYGPAGTLNFNTAFNYFMNATDCYWPTTNGPFNVNVLNGGLVLGGSRVVNGLFTTANVSVNGGIGFSGQTLTLNGTVNINAGGFFLNAPIYGAASTLIYKTGGSYNRSFEWSAIGAGTIGTTPGYPNNLQLSTTGTTLNYNSTTANTRAIAGNLTIDTGTTFLMNDGGGASNGPFAVAGNFINAGSITLGNTSLFDDLKVGGANFTNTGTFNHNNRAVFFTKASGTQIVSSSTPLTIPYVVFDNSTGSRTVQLAPGTNLLISAPSTGNAISFGTSSDIFDINGNTLTIGTASFANTITGDGTFKGSATSLLPPNLTLLGTGNIGTLKFTTNFENLGTLTVNRTSGAIAFALGTPVTINTSLVLTNGIADLGNNAMTIAAAATITSSATNYIIADLANGANASLRKVFSAPGSFLFPIGDGAASANGTQYLPITATFTGGTYAGYAGFAVHNIKDPNLDAPNDFITRYWNMTSSGIAPTSYSLSSLYYATDVIGNETLCQSNQWNGTSWNNNGITSAANTMVINNVTTLPAVNHFTKGNRLAEINVKAASGGFGNIADGSVTPIFSNNTLFNSTTLGSTSTKDFEIQSTGTVALTLTGTPFLVTIGGTNPGDFAVTTQPSSSSLAGGTSTTFIITFTPQFAGVRSATVTILNSDSDEGTYDFVIQGTGTCPTMTNTISPASGPENTEVTITGTAANLAGATVTFNSVPATVTVISPTQITVKVPAGAVSGNIITTNSQGCSAYNLFTVIDTVIASCPGGTPPNELFISEVTDSNFGGLEYVEIYNGTSAPIQITNYGLKVANNGSGYGFTTGLTGAGLVGGMLPVGATYVVGLGDDDACLTPGGNGSYANQTTPSGGINFIANEHDHIALFRVAVQVDSWGTFGALNWAPVSIGAEGATFRRKKTATTLPSVTYNNADWDIVNFPGTACADNNYTDVGIYDFSRGLPPVITSDPTYTPSCKSTSLAVTTTVGFTGTFQWFAVAPGAPNWTPLSNTLPYSGVTTATLTIADVSALGGYQYYCQVTGNGSSCYSASNAVKIILTPTVTWNGAGWLPNAPTISSKAIINGDYDTSVHGSFEACSVTVNGGFDLIIEDGLILPNDHYVSIQNDLTVNSTANLQVLDGGSLVMLDDLGVVTNNGTMQVHRDSAPYEKYDYTYWSSPVNSSNIATTFLGWRTDYSFSFNTVNFADLNNDTFDDATPYAWTFAGPAANMLQGVGYAIMGDTSQATYPYTSNVTFTGKVNNGVVAPTIALSGNAADSNDDFNLIGNPYPSSIWANTFITNNAITNSYISGTLYFWTHVDDIAPSTGPNAQDFTTDDYAYYNLSGGTVSASGSVQPNGYIASGQGFLVEAVAPGTVTFNNSMRNKLFTNTQFFRNSNDIADRDRLWLNLQNTDGMFSQQLIGYFSEATQSYDPGYDGLVNASNNFVSFYSFIDEEKCRIQGRTSFDTNDQVNLGYFAGMAGAFTIRIDHAEGQLNTIAHIYLEDKLLNIFHDLNQAPYNFVTEAGTFDGRFVLRYTTETLGISEFEFNNDAVIIVAKDSRIDIKSIFGSIRKVAVFDILGRQIYLNNDIDDVEYMIEDISNHNQSLIVKVTLQNGFIVTKKIIL